MPWLPRNSKALDPDSINHSKLPRTSSDRCSRKPPQVESHQFSQEVTSQTVDNMASKEETWKWDKETMFPRLTHLVQDDGGQPGRDSIWARKRGGGGPAVPPMATTGNREKPVYCLILHKLGQGQICVLKERTWQRGKRQVKSRGRLCLSVQEMSCWFLHAMELPDEAENNPKRVIPVQIDRIGDTILVVNPRTQREGGRVTVQRRAVPVSMWRSPLTQAQTRRTRLKGAGAARC